VSFYINKNVGKKEGARERGNSGERGKEKGGRTESSRDKKNKRGSFIAVPLTP
jgi:hypothetical protein